MADPYGYISFNNQNQSVSPNVSPIAGNAIGIIAVNLDYPKLPGNVANATTFTFPVDYEVIDLEIEQLFENDPAAIDVIVNAAKRLEARGVKAIVGACGYFANFQHQVQASVRVPVILSSLAQLPLISLSLRADQKIAVLVADINGADQKLLDNVNANDHNVIFVDVGSLPEFHAIRYGQTVLDNGALTRVLMQKVQSVVADHPEVGAILLECSDLPPYAAAIQAAVKRPVFDFIMLINWLHQSVCQKPYSGFF